MVACPDVLDRGSSGKHNAFANTEPVGKSLENLAHRPFTVERQAPWPLFPQGNGQGLEENVLALGRGMQPGDAGETELICVVEGGHLGEALRSTFTGLRTTSAFRNGSPICFSASRRFASETEKQRRAKGSTARYRVAISSARQLSSELLCPIVTNGTCISPQNSSRSNGGSAAPVEKTTKAGDVAAICRLISVGNRLLNGTRFSGCRRIE